MEEVWKDVRNYEGLYQVSNLGRVKVLSHKIKRGFCTCFCDEKVLKLSVKDNGYLFVRLSKGNKKTTKSFYVHRLVASAFIPNSNPFYNQIDHIDGDKKNNVVDNLRWVNQSININNPITKAQNRKLVKIICYDKKGSFIRSFDSITQASKCLNIPISTISYIISRKRNKVKNKGIKCGYKFVRNNI